MNCSFFDVYAVKENQKELILNIFIANVLPYFQSSDNKTICEMVEEVKRSTDDIEEEFGDIGLRHFRRKMLEKFSSIKKSMNEVSMDRETANLMLKTIKESGEVPQGVLPYLGDIVCTASGTEKVLTFEQRRELKDLVFNVKNRLFNPTNPSTAFQVHKNIKILLTDFHESEKSAKMKQEIKRLLDFDFPVNKVEQILEKLLEKEEYWGMNEEKFTLFYNEFSSEIEKDRLKSVRQPTEKERARFNVFKFFPQRSFESVDFTEKYMKEKNIPELQSLGIVRTAALMVKKNKDRDERMFEAVLSSLYVKPKHLKQHVQVEKKVEIENLEEKISKILPKQDSKILKCTKEFIKNHNLSEEEAFGVVQVAYQTIPDNGDNTLLEMAFSNIISKKDY